MHIIIYFNWFKLLPRSQFKLRRVLVDGPLRDIPFQLDMSFPPTFLDVAQPKRSTAAPVWGIHRAVTQAGAGAIYAFQLFPTDSSVVRSAFLIAIRAQQNYPFSKCFKASIATDCFLLCVRWRCRYLLRPLWGVDPSLKECNIFNSLSMCLFGRAF